MAVTKDKPTMLRSLKDLTGYPVEAVDDEIGKCRDFLIDDEHWAVRYLVVDTRKWLPGRKVLISPYQFGDPEVGPQAKRFPVNLTKERIKESPPLESDSPVSRLYELEMARFYNYRPYWGATVGAWGGAYYPNALGDDLPRAEEWERHREALAQVEQHHLRSADELRGYAIRATDDEIGHVEDFVVETASWTVRWMVVDTRNFLPGKHVIVTPEWIKAVDWNARAISVDVAKEKVKNAPEFDRHQPINRDYEGRIYDYYGRPRYW